MMEFYAMNGLSTELTMLFQRELEQNIGKIKVVKFIRDHIILHPENEANLLKILGEII